MICTKACIVALTHSAVEPKGAVLDTLKQLRAQRTAIAVRLAERVEPHLFNEVG